MNRRPVIRRPVNQRPVNQRPVNQHPANQRPAKRRYPRAIAPCALALLLLCGPPSRADEQADLWQRLQALEDAGITYEVRVMSAHRDPELVVDYCTNAKMRGLKVIIAGAGMSAALPGVAAAHTELPVIGVPILGKSLGGLDALLSAVQMPPGVPVACVAIDGAKNAGVLATRIINLAA